MGRPESCDPRRVPNRRTAPKDAPIIERRLLALCEMTGLSLGKLGESVGLSDEALPRIIREARAGRRRYPGSMETYGRLADKYDLPTDWLTGRSDEPIFVGKPKPPSP
jgi:hypothetical protein